MEHKPKIRVPAIGPCPVSWFQLVPGSPIDDLMPKSVYRCAFFGVRVSHLLVGLLCCVLLKFRIDFCQNLEAEKVPLWAIVHYFLILAQKNM